MTETRMTRDDLTVIRASAERIAEIADLLGQQTKRDIQVEAAAIIALIDNQLKKATP